MIIDKLSENALKIYLDNDDFKKYNIKSSDINVKTVKKFLIEISNEISDILNLDAATAKFFVEVFSYKNSCHIFLSNMDNPRTSKIKSEKIICQFEIYESLENFCRILNALYKNSLNESILYCGNESIRLILKLSSDFENISYFASAYCNVIPYDEISKGITQEYYKKIISHNAVREILLSVTQ